MKEIEEEIWKPVFKPYNKTHEVSNLGKIRTIDRYVKSKRNNIRLNKSRILKPSFNKINGYMTIRLVNTFIITTTLHRIIAIAFIPNYNNLPSINHIDGNKLNNNIDNLEWVSHSENTKRAVKLGLHKSGKEYSGSKPVIKLDLNDNIIAEYNSIKEASFKNNISKTSIGNVCNGYNYYKTAGGFKWKFKLKS